VPPADESPAAFYDGLAGEYHAIYDDWWAGAKWHAGIVDAILQSAGIDRDALVLDCACGIGTQALGLAHLGYRVVGTDISANAIARAEREATEHALDVTLAVADMRSVHEVQPGPFDAVICCDNALPHLLTDSDLDAALGSIRRTLRAGGVFLASVRDYDRLLEDRPTGIPSVVRNRPEGREIYGQAWEWLDRGEQIRIHLFFLRERAGAWTSEVHTTAYRPVTRALLSAAFARAGFVDVIWLAPAESGYYQPMVTARVVSSEG
jgi:glycine/sarcosine N-methyltransferase